MDFIGKMQHVTMVKDWKWNGPEVVRNSPPDDVLRQIKPDSNGIIHSEYTVVVLHRDSKGSILKSESFTAKDVVPASLLKSLKESSKEPLEKRRN